MRGRSGKSARKLLAGRAACRREEIAHTAMLTTDSRGPQPPPAPDPRNSTRSMTVATHTARAPAIHSSHHSVRPRSMRAPARIVSFGPHLVLSIVPVGRSSDHPGSEAATGSAYGLCSCPAATLELRPWSFRRNSVIGPREVRLVRSRFRSRTGWKRQARRSEHRCARIHTT